MKARREAATPRFARMLLMQASGAGGDALVALALAGSLFFSVPEADARGRVALYLLVTMAPFSIVAPVLSGALDRHPGGLRAAIVLSAAGRGVLAWLLATRLDTFLLFPIAFGVLVLSRAALVAKGALLPMVVPEGRSLVEANASLSKVTALSGVIFGGMGIALVHWLSSHADLLVATGVYLLGVLPSIGLPTQRRRSSTVPPIEARQKARAVTVRQAVFATGTLRLLVGFLVFHLGFAFRREDLTSLGLGVLIACAASGALLGALLAPRLRRRLREEGIIAVSLVIAGVSGIIAGRWFSLATASALVFSFGIASGASKVAFDSIVQRDTPEGARGWAFARFEAVLQLSWVAGAFVPVILSIPADTGVAAAGVLATAAALVYVLGRRSVADRAALSVTPPR
ncbi:MAG: hypothetical protein M3124_04820 [Actinomycetota bacterium]|nr:hypothetical protein [Actinomycetota bacterium]